MDEANSKSLQSEIARRIEDLSTADPEGTAVTLVLVALGILAKKFPPNLDDKSRQHIMDNYPSATEELISQRAMAEHGVVMAVAAGIQMARIAVDYSPLTHVKLEMDKDFTLPEEVLKATTSAMTNTFDKAIENGISPFGAAATMILLATVKAKQHGVTGLKIIRPLLDAMNKGLEGDGPSLSEEEATENAIRLLREQLGISRKAALQYVAYAKQNKRP